MTGRRQLPAGEETPRARRSGLVERRVNHDLVVYDVRSHRAHSLDFAARNLWKWCDGMTPLTTLQRRLGALLELSPEDARSLVSVTLCRLAEADLLDNRFACGPNDEIDRRRCLGALVALPMVVGILVPSAADAQSLPGGSPCSSSSQCASGCCNSASNRCTGGGPSCL